MKKNIITIIFGIVLIFGFIYLGNLGDSSISEYSEFFGDELARAGVERVGQPIEGFSAPIYLEAFPGFVAKDFDGVESLEGIYNLKDGELVYRRTAGNPVTSAEDTISTEGYSTLLSNLSKRLGVEVKSELDIAVLLERLREADSVKKSYISDDFSVWYPEGWYPYENNHSVLFTHEENLKIPANTEGFAIGPWMQVTVEMLDGKDGNALNIDDWFARNLWVEGSEFLVSKSEVVIGTLKFTRVVTLAAGAGGEVLHYVFYDEPSRVITISNYPYDPQSQDTDDFEMAVRTFMPNFIGDGPDKSGILPFDSGVSGRVLLGPTCPVMREPPDPNCADKPYVTTVQVISVASSNSAPFATVKTDKEGGYTVMLPPGLYSLQAIGGRPFPSCSTKTVTIEPDTMSKIDLMCDTGIR